MYTNGKFVVMLYANGKFVVMLYAIVKFVVMLYARDTQSCSFQLTWGFFNMLPLIDTNPFNRRY